MTVNLAAVAESVAGSVIPLTHQHQDQTQWCWAACAVMIIDALGIRPLPRQCDIVNDRLPVPSCCEEGQSEYCNRSCEPDEISEVLGRRSVPWTRRDRVSFETIQDEISNQRPLELYLSSAAGGHVVVLSGWHVASTPMVRVNDPLLDTVEDWSYDSLAQRGWDYTWVRG